MLMFSYNMETKARKREQHRITERMYANDFRNQNITVEQESVMTEQSHIHRICPVSYIIIKYESCSNSCARVYVCNVVAACDCQHIAIPFILNRNSNKLFPFVLYDTHLRAALLTVIRVLYESQKYKGVT